MRMGEIATKRREFNKELRLKSVEAKPSIPFLREGIEATNADHIAE